MLHLRPAGGKGGEDGEDAVGHGATDMTNTASLPLNDRSKRVVPLPLSVWILFGLYLDVWSHNPPTAAESFFSPWHAILYSGWLVTALWVIWPLARALREEHRSAAEAIDVLSVAGVLTFAMGGITDMLWHVALGIELGFAVMLSPPHILVGAGIILIVSGPFRGAWAASAETVPTLRALLPAVISLALATSIIGLGASAVWGFSHADFLRMGSLEQVAAELAPTARGRYQLQELLYQRSVSNIVVTNLVLLAPVFVMLRRWRLPFGAITVFLTLTTMLVAISAGVPLLIMLLVSLSAGLVADWLVGMLGLSPQRTPSLRMFAAAVPVVLWGLYMAAVHVEWGVAWPPAIWGGALVWASGSGLLLSIVAAPGDFPAQVPTN